MVDGLRWLRRWGAKEVLVNTQEGNEPAVRLYQALGFQLRPEGLAVLRLALGEAPRVPRRVVALGLLLAVLGLAVAAAPPPPAAAEVPDAGVGADHRARVADAGGGRRRVVRR